jgi:hypothetical protein
MAVLSAGQVIVVWSVRGARCWTLFAVENVTTADTVDLSSFYRVVKQTMWMGATVIGAVAGTFTATVATAPAGLSADAAYLFVDGVPL